MSRVLSLAALGAQAPNCPSAPGLILDALLLMLLQDKLTPEGTQRGCWGWGGGQELLHLQREVIQESPSRSVKPECFILKLLLLSGSKEKK